MVVSAAAPPGKQPPAKKAAPAKAKPRVKLSKPKGPKGKADSAPSAPIATSMGAGAQLMLLPTNLPVCVVDNGGWTVKYGLVPHQPEIGSAKNGEAKHSDGTATASSSGDNTHHMSSMLNATARPPHQLTVLAGDEITMRMKNLGQLTWNYPLERGMITDGEAQLRVWARVLEVMGVVPAPAMGGRMGGGGGFLASMAAARRGKQGVDANAGKPQPTHSSNNCALLLLEPPFVPSAISEGVDCMLFRELGMARVARMLAPCMAAYHYLSFCISSAASGGEWTNDDTKCCCVVDSGYSFTHVVPTFRGEASMDAIRRLNVGGKVLTNLLKEAVTYRQWNMMSEYHLVNDAKEQLCFVSDQFDQEMRKSRATRKGMRWFDREYLLPDFATTFRGSVRLPEPLQRKREMEEMEAMRKEMEKTNEEKERRELEEEAKELANMQAEGIDDEKEEEKAETTAKGRQRKKAPKASKSKKAKTKKRKRDNQSKAAEGEEDAEQSGNDSDEETDQQRMQRLKAMREQERKRREQESLERQALAMSVERFAIPEVLFRPSDIGLDCGGIAEAIVESINACDPILRAAMYHNVLLVGGNAKIPGFKERVEAELRSLAPSNYEVRVYMPEDPASYAWEGARKFSSRPGFQERFSVDRLSWESLKKAGKDQQEIWGKRMHATIAEVIK
ncbi:hypothetical protein ACHAXT_008166 [Thalassiosira profunda]